MWLKMRSISKDAPFSQIKQKISKRMAGVHTDCIFDMKVLVQMVCVCDGALS